MHNYLLLNVLFQMSTDVTTEALRIQQKNDNINRATENLMQTETWKAIQEVKTLQAKVNTYPLQIFLLPMSADVTAHENRKKSVNREWIS